MADASGEILSTSGVPYQGWDPWTDSYGSFFIGGQPVTALIFADAEFAVFAADSTGGILETSVSEAVQRRHDYHRNPIRFYGHRLHHHLCRRRRRPRDLKNAGDGQPVARKLSCRSFHSAVSFAWSVVNKGDADEAELQKGVEKALSALVKTSVTTLSKDISQPLGAALGAAIGAAIGTAAISLTGSAIVALAGYVLSQVVGIVFADCDGTITTGLRVYTNTQILGGSMSGDDVIRDIVLDQGTDSPIGCGANSEYQTTTTITSFPRIVPTNRTAPRSRLLFYVVFYNWFETFIRVESTSLHERSPCFSGSPCLSPC